MDYNILQKNLETRLYTASTYSFTRAEDYFFTLGQLLTYVFLQLGGAHQYKKEFNYLTNPYLPKNVQELGIRISRFLSKVPDKIISENDRILQIHKAIIADCHKYCTGYIDMDRCNDAFFEGLHHDNALLKLLKKEE